MSYATVAQLREYLGQVATGAAQDAKLQTILDRATVIVDGALGFGFAAYGEEASERDVSGSRDLYLRLPAYEAGSVATVAAVYGRGTSYESTGEVSDWLAEEELRPYRLYCEHGWPERWYRVTAIWGYGPAPADVVEVEIEVAVNIWRGRDASMWQSEVGAGGEGGMSFNRALTWAQRSIIDAVRAQYLGVVHA